ncbi:MAG: rhomboid family intramembrane serine protease, partial [Desulfobacula sp.]|nr:rhomboid family intramembrane serine protease [Desulfobacula sp.]
MMTQYKNTHSFLTPSFVMNAMIYTNVIMFFISLVYSGKNMILSFNPFYAFTPSMDVLNFLGASGRFPIVKFEAWWSLITANWLHGGLLHILFNMMALKTLAPLVMKEFGLYRMFSIYTLTGIAGFLLSYFGNVYLTIGASSGLCGLIGASLFFGKSRGGE